MAKEMRCPNPWVQATLDYAFCGFLSQWPSAPDPVRSAPTLNMLDATALQLSHLARREFEAINVRLTTL